ncbi:hypothetical protein GCM10027456_27080 [Kineosporia babensis]
MQFFRQKRAARVALLAVTSFAFLSGGMISTATTASAAASCYDDLEWTRDGKYWKVQHTARCTGSGRKQVGVQWGLTIDGPGLVNNGSFLKNSSGKSISMGSNKVLKRKGVHDYCINWTMQTQEANEHGQTRTGKSCLYQ